MQRLHTVPAGFCGMADDDLRGEDHGHRTGDTRQKPDDGESRNRVERGHGKQQRGGGKQATKRNQPLPPRPPGRGGENRACEITGEISSRDNSRIPRRERHIRHHAGQDGGKGKTAETHSGGHHQSACKTERGQMSGGKWLVDAHAWLIATGRIGDKRVILIGVISGLYR